VRTPGHGHMKRGIKPWRIIQTPRTKQPCAYINIWSYKLWVKFQKPRAHKTLHITWSYYISNDHGPGISPGPTPRPIYKLAKLNILKHIHLTRITCGPLVGRSYEGARRCGRSEGRTPRTPPYILHINHKPTNEGHVAPMDWATCPHTICHQTDTCQLPIRNSQPTIACHVTTVRSYGLYSPATSDCTDWYSQHLIFFACLP
jgi:hypothetical protein